LFPWWICDTTYHVDLALEVHADYRETRLGNGLINGHGSAVVESHNLPAGRAEKYGVQVGNSLPFVFAGRVAAYGEVEGSAVAPGREPSVGSARLSANGLALELVGLDRTVQVRKDLCGNRAPTVKIHALQAESMPYGQFNMVSADYEDTEDESIPNERLVWTSDQEEDEVDNGSYMDTSDLSPGRHTITFTATDSGGLSGSDRVVIAIENDVPAPVIEEPARDSDNHCQGQDITFRGYANDDQGNLTGDELIWTAIAETRQTDLGTGDLVLAPLAAGSYRIRLTANDGVASGWDEVGITVKSRCEEGETKVTITYPEHRSAPVTGWPSYYTHPEVAPDPDDQNPFCVWLRARARGPTNTPYTGPDLVWTDEPQGVFSSRNLGTGNEVYACHFPAPEGEGDLMHTITVRAPGTDASDSIDIVVIGPGAGGVGGVY
jgi:hypothetical protein